jgi:pilus assembly protein Flp/PilA
VPNGLFRGPKSGHGAIVSGGPSYGQHLRKGGEDPVLAHYVWLTNLVADLRPRRSDGQGLAEYALILALIAVLAIVALIFLGSQIRSILSRVGNSI